MHEARKARMQKGDESTNLSGTNLNERSEPYGECHDGTSNLRSVLDIHDSSEKGSHKTAGANLL